MPTKRSQQKRTWNRRRVKHWMVPLQHRVPAVTNRISLTQRDPEERQRVSKHAKPQRNQRRTLQRAQKVGVVSLYCFPLLPLCTAPLYCQNTKTFFHLIDAGPKPIKERRPHVHTPAQTTTTPAQVHAPHTPVVSPVAASMPSPVSATHLQAAIAPANSGTPPAATPSPAPPAPGSEGGTPQCKFLSACAVCVSSRCTQCVGSFETNSCIFIYSAGTTVEEQMVSIHSGQDADILPEVASPEASTRHNAGSAATTPHSRPPTPGTRGVALMRKYKLLAVGASSADKQHCLHQPAIQPNSRLTQYVRRFEDQGGWRLGPQEYWDIRWH